MNDILKKIGVNEKLIKLTKVRRKEKVFTKVKDVVPPIEDLNFMTDLLILPTTKKGYKYLVVMVDLASDEFDIEPIKTKTPKETLKAVKKIFKRKWLNEPKTIRTDGGNEFKGEFNEYFYNRDVMHKTTLPGRHRQMSNVENLNRQLGKMFNSYMNNVEMEIGKQYNEWTDVIDIIREDMNKLRVKKTYTEKEYIKEIVPKIGIFEPKKDPKFKKNDIVYRKLDRPKNTLGKDINTDKFREGDFRFDPVPRKIKRVLYYNGLISYRYILEGFPQVSYTERELLNADEEDEKFEIKKIIGKKKIKNRIHYLVWWKGNLKKDATYEPKKELIKDGAKVLIDDFESRL